MNKSFVLLAVALLATAGCVDRAQQKQAQRTQQLLNDPVRPVKVQTIARQTISQSLEITGDLVTSEDVQVGAKVAGRLTAVYVNDGDAVKAEQVIAVQDTTDAQSRIRQASAQVNAARSQYSQAVSNAAIQPSKSTSAVNAAEAQLRQAQAQYKKVQTGARPEEIRQAEAAVTAAESNMNTAKRELERTQTLVDQGALPRARLDSAQNAYTAAVSQYQQALQALNVQRQLARPEDLEMAREQVRAAEEAVRQARAQKKLDVLLNDQVSAAKANLDAAVAALDMARQALTDAQIKAPFAGRISGRPVQPGTFLSPGAPVARIVGGSGTYFEGNIPESMIGEVSQGKGVRVSIDALPGRTFYGTVVGINPAGEQLGRLFTVRVQLGGSLEGIRPGMFARGSVDVRSVTDAIVVPQRALVESQGKSYVYVIENGQAKRVQVQPGIRQGEQVEVKGLREGQQVVIDGQSQLGEGTKVKIEGGAA